MGRQTLIVALALAAMAMTVQAELVYKWVDKDGTVHYSEKPPAGRKSSAMEVSGGMSREAPPAPDSAEAIEANAAAQRAEYCAQATRKYQVLTQTEREVQSRDEYGEIRTLSAEERAEAAAGHKAKMDEFCEPAA